MLFFMCMLLRISQIWKYFQILQNTIQIHKHQCIYEHFMTAFLILYPKVRQLPTSLQLSMNTLNSQNIQCMKTSHTKFKIEKLKII